jgi:hypothetical protein
VPSSVHAPAAQQAPSARPLDKKGSPGSLNHIEGLGIKLLIFIAACGLLAVAIFKLGDGSSASSAPEQQNAPSSPGSSIEAASPGRVGTAEAASAPSAAEAARVFGQYSMQDYVGCASAAMTIYAVCTEANDTSTPGCVAARFQLLKLYPQAMNSLITSGASSTAERDAYFNAELQTQQRYNQALSPEDQLRQALQEDNYCIQKHGHLAQYVTQ